MTEIINSNQDAPESQPAKPVRTLEALLEFYAQGHRNFSGSDLRGVTVDMMDKEIKYIDLRGVILTGSNLAAALLTRYTSDFKVDLTGSYLDNCNLQAANFSHASLDRCNFSSSDLSGADLLNISCRGSDFIRAILQNIRSSENTDFTASDFTGANFSLSTVSGNFTAANFTRTNFLAAQLIGKFIQANFSDADLRSVKFLERSGGFRLSNFSGANLHSANLAGDFSQSNFSNAILGNARFYCFHVQGSDFSDADLRIDFVDGGTFKYCYYNSNTKFSECLDPVASGMELIEDEIESED